jgi:hypothetical protein
MRCPDPRAASNDRAICSRMAIRRWVHHSTVGWVLLFAVLLILVSLCGMHIAGAHHDQHAHALAAAIVLLFGFGIPVITATSDDLEVDADSQMAGVASFVAPAIRCPRHGRPLRC